MISSLLILQIHKNLNPPNFLTLIRTFKRILSPICPAIHIRSYRDVTIFVKAPGMPQQIFKSLLRLLTGPSNYIEAGNLSWYHYGFYFFIVAIRTRVVRVDQKFFKCYVQVLLEETHVKWQICLVILFPCEDKRAYACSYILY